MQQLASAAQINCEVITVPTGRKGDVLHVLCSQSQRGIILRGPAATLLASHTPEALAAVVASRRLALIDGLVDLPMIPQIENVRVDVLTVDWPRIAERIAADTVTGEASNQTQPIMFEAKPLLHQRLGTLMQPL